MGLSNFREMTQQSRPSLFYVVLPSLFSRALLIFGAAVIAILYSILLPFGFTQRFEFHNWQYLTPLVVGLSLAYGIGIAWVIACQISAMKQVAASRGKGIGVFGAVVGVLPSMLCCTPIIPTVISALGISGVTLLSTSGHIQGFFATHGTWIELGGLGILVLSSVWSTYKLRNAICLTSGCDIDVVTDVHVDDSSISIGGHFVNVEELINDSNSGGNVL